MTLTIYDRVGSAKYAFPGAGLLLMGMRRESVYMESDTLSVQCASVEGIDVSVGDYVVVSGNKYRVNQSPSVTRSGQNGLYEYNIVMESVKYDLANVRFLLPGEADGDFYTGSMQELIAILVENANRVYPFSWAIGTVPATPVITQQFTEMNCLAALQAMMSAWYEEFEKNYEFSVTTENGVSTINVIEEGAGADTGLSLSYGHKGGLYSIERQYVASESICNRLYVYGSSDNVPAGYRHSRLCLPGAKRNGSYVENSSSISSHGVKEGMKVFESIKPTAKFTVSSVMAMAGRVNIVSSGLASGSQYGFWIEDNWADTTDDYEEWKQMYGYQKIEGDAEQDVFLRGWYDGTTGGTATRVVGTKKYVVNGEVTITFNTGNCAGMSFSMVEGSSNRNGAFALIPVKYNENEPNEYIVPSNNPAYRIVAGDEFVISGIMLPISLINKAEAELRDKAVQEVNDAIVEATRYSVEFDKVKRAGMDTSVIVPGSYVRVVDSQLGINNLIKVERVSEDYVSNDFGIGLSNIKYRKSTAGTFATRTTTEPIVQATPDLVIGTSLTCQFTANYDYTSSAPTSMPCNTLLVGDGTFANSSLSGSYRVWHIKARVVMMKSDAKFDIYVQASKKSDNATIVLVKNNEIEVNGIRSALGTAQNIVKSPFIRSTPVVNVLGSLDPNCYYFKVGSISEARIGRGFTKYRTLTLEYGVGNINATDLTAGAMSSNVVVRSGDEQINIADRLVTAKSNFANLEGWTSDITNTIKHITDTLKASDIPSATCDERQEQCAIDPVQGITIPDVPVIG